MQPQGQAIDFNERPFLVIWEITQACDLACVHCRACAQPARSALELSTAEARQLIDQVADLKAPVFVITGGDPLKRPDIYQLVGYATMRGIRISLTPSATPLLTRDAIAELKLRGLARLAVSLDGSCAAVHDEFRRVPGSFQLTMDAIRSARELGLPVQINTTVTRRNLRDFDATARLLQTLDIALWSVFFLVPTGRGQASDLLSAEECEQVFARLYDLSQSAGFDIKTTEAQHYRRYVLQQKVAGKRNGGGAARGGRRYLAGGADAIGRAPRGLNDGKGFVFISHTGEVFPSGFLPVSAGNVRKETLADIYRYSPLFVSLRNTDLLEGKCGRCEFRNICGGSRARAYAVTGNVLAEEPCCVYEPQAGHAVA